MKVTICCLGSSFFGLQGGIEDENINTGFLGLLLVLVSVLWVSILCLSQFFLSFPASPSLCFFPYPLSFFLSREVAFALLL